MPRRDFVRDLQETQNGALPLNIVSLQPGQDDGTLVIVFQCPDSQQIQIHAQISDVGDYPRSHSFFVFTDSEDVPPEISSALSEVSVLNEATVFRTIAQVAAILNHAVGELEQDENIDMGGEEEEEDSEDVYQSDEFPIEEEAGFHIDDNEHFIGSARISNQQIQELTIPLFEKDQKAFSDRVRQDLSLLKEAGFRVSSQGSILLPGVPCLLMISIRVAKLELPDDALEAWHLHPSEYIMLLFKYKRGYCTLQMLQFSSKARENLTMHILVTKKHKLTTEEVLKATKTQKEKGIDCGIAEKVNDLDRMTRPLFIGTALEELLNSRLHTLISHRMDFNLNWAGAIAYDNARQGEIRAAALNMNEFLLEEDESKIHNLPKYIRADPLQKLPPPSSEKLSFPWIAMQFTLRHIVRCTEFCLVCFDKTKDDFEALKPYVCSKPLCLYQYMAMGLGPGIEFEILSQKYVVDLLVSFCWESANMGNLKKFPIGLGLMVPDPTTVPGYLTRPPNTPYGTIPNGIPTANHGPPATGSWVKKHCEIVLTDKSAIEKTFKVGDWLVFWTTGYQVYHCQVTEKFHPKYRYKNAVRSCNTKDFKDLGVKNWPDPTTDIMDINIVPYDTLFDSLSESSRHTVIRILLDTLPNVQEMSDYLRTSQGLRGQLIGWTERIIPTAVSMLRWIIASNRSCIVYNEKISSDEIVHGMPGYLQFRFASGAPDKESRFVKSVNEIEQRLKQRCPTIFAWHGSPLKNWHSIIREGLNFDQVVNGRAYGNGVYHALQAQTSLGYSARYGNIQSWPSSLLNIQQTLSLNEIVNAPLEFQSRSPHLVVQKLDWIQTRYLFVKCGKSELTKDWALRSQPSLVVTQDPDYTPVDEKATRLIIPACAISKSRRQAQDSDQRVAGNLRHFHNTGINNQIEVSDESDEECIASFLSASDSSEGSFSQSLSRREQIDTATLAVIPFQPGRMDRSKLPMLASPTYATSASTKALHRELHNMLTEQLETPSAELGWYIDPDHVENIYQWIIELHSFDKNLPLAKDMLKQDVESIVLEIRFGPNFNFSPPFIRVVRPRFLPFAQGGGGHVTAGGAICMELLTSDGWNPSSTMSAVLLQVRMAITSLDPKPARLECGRSLGGGYSCGEAAQAYTRACQMHGWRIPDDFQSMVSMTEVIRRSLPSGAQWTSGGQRSDPFLVEDDDVDDALLTTGQPDLKKRRHI